MRLVISAFFVVSLVYAAPLSAQTWEWGSVATIGAEPEAGRICTGDAAGKNIVCASSAPYVNNSGKVGIGTDNPIRSLHINAPSLYVGTRNSLGQWDFGQNYFYHYYATAIDRPRFGYNRDLNPSGGYSGTLVFVSADYLDTAGTGIGSPQSKHLAFFTSNGIELTERMRVDGSGNVGIGERNPSEKLEVVGNAKFDGTLQIAGTGSETCVLGSVGKVRYNPISKRIEICRE